MNERNHLLAFFGHHKCATRWINTIIEQVCHDLNLKFMIVHHPGMFDNRLDLLVKEKKVDFLSYDNAKIEFVKTLDKLLGFHVIRDPRDIVVSAYFSHLHTHSVDRWPSLLVHRERLQKASKEEGLFLEMEFRKAEFEDLYNWDYCQPNVLEIKMEDVIKSPYETMVNALCYLRLIDDTRSFKQSFLYILASAIDRLRIKSKGLIPLSISKNKIPVDVLLGCIYHNRFSQKAGDRKKGVENVKSHYRKGVAGDWVNHFTEEHRIHFKRNYNDLLMKLGYETKPDW